MTRNALETGARERHREVLNRNPQPVDSGGVGAIAPPSEENKCRRAHNRLDIDHDRSSPSSTLDTTISRGSARGLRSLTNLQDQRIHISRWVVQTEIADAFQLIASERRGAPPAGSDSPQHYFADRLRARHPTELALEMPAGENSPAAKISTLPLIETARAFDRPEWMQFSSRERQVDGSNW